jgi:hypothetical protein
MHDHKAWHFVAIEENTVIGCVLNPLNPEKRKRSSCKWLLKPTNNERVSKVISRGITSFANPMELKK